MARLQTQSTIARILYNSLPCAAIENLARTQRDFTRYKKCDLMVGRAGLLQGHHCSLSVPTRLCCGTQSSEVTQCPSSSRPLLSTANCVTENCGQLCQYLVRCWICAVCCILCSARLCAGLQPSLGLVVAATGRGRAGSSSSSSTSWSGLAAVLLIPAPAAPRHHRNTQVVHLSLDAVTQNFTQFLLDEFTDFVG